LCGRCKELSGSDLQLLQVRLYGHAQAANAFANLLWPGVGEVQAKMPATFLALPVRSEERISWNKGDILLECFVKKLVCVHTLRQSHPEEQASLGMGLFHFWWKILRESLEHDIAALPVNIANFLHV